MAVHKEFRDKLEHAAVLGCRADPGTNCKFVPNSALESIMTYETISQTLQSINGYEPYHIPVHARHIESKARKTFAILLLIAREALILEFLQRDLLDAKLPLRFICDVDNMFLDAAGQRLFMENQWRFLAPEFSLERSLICKEFPEDTILPFTNEEPLGDRYSMGTSGQMSKIWIHPLHQTYLSDKRASHVSWFPILTKNEF